MEEPLESDPLMINRFGILVKEDPNIPSPHEPMAHIKDLRAVEGDREFEWGSLGDSDGEESSASVFGNRLISKSKAKWERKKKRDNSKDVVSFVGGDLGSFLQKHVP